METLSEYFVLALLVLMFSVPVVLNRISRWRKKGSEAVDETE